MKKLTILFLTLSLLHLTSCNSNNSKQTLPAESISDNIVTESNETGKGESHINVTDTMVYEIPAVTAVLENAVDYFRSNNKYQNWNKDDKKIVIIKCVVEKDGSTSNIRILRDGSGNIDLDNEAIRLIKQAKLTPAKNENIRSYWTIAVHFPAE